MKVGQLIKILQSVDPDSHVCFGIGDAPNDKYRDACAKVQLQRGECLDFLDIQKVEINIDGDEDPFIDIILEQSNWPQKAFDEVLKEFNDAHPDIDIKYGHD